MRIQSRVRNASAADDLLGSYGQCESMGQMQMSECRLPTDEHQSENNTIAEDGASCYFSDRLVSTESEPPDLEASRGNLGMTLQAIQLSGEGLF